MTRVRETSVPDSSHMRRNVSDSTYAVHFEEVYGRRES